MMVLHLMLEEISVFKMPAQKGNYTYFSVNRPMYQSVGHPSDNRLEPLTHHKFLPHRYAFSNITKIDTVYNAKNRLWQGIHNAISTDKNRELFETDFIVQGNHSNVDSTTIHIKVNKH